RVRLDAAVGADVAGGKAALGQGPRHQQAAVAVEWLALGAKKAQAMTPDFLNHAVEPGTKWRARTHSPVIDNPVAVERPLARSPAKRISEPEIGDAFGGEPLGQWLTREPRAPA